MPKTKLKPRGVRAKAATSVTLQDIQDSSIRLVELHIWRI